jgi:hypothetical protein
MGERRFPDTGTQVDDWVGLVIVYRLNLTSTVDDWKNRMVWEEEVAYTWTPSTAVLAFETAAAV